jgi:Fibronectin type III domain/HYR domain
VRARCFRLVLLATLALLLSMGHGLAFASRASVTAPDPPTNVNATLADNSSARVTWSAPLNTGGGSPFIAKYTVTSSPGGLTATTTGGSTTSAVVHGLAPGTTYTFTVVATTISDSTPSLPSNPVTTPTAPNPPTNVNATLADNSSASVAWSAPLNTGGSPITKYTVTSSPGGLAATTPDGSTTSAVVHGLAPGTTYTFTVVATTISDSTPSLPSNAVTTPYTVPGVPTGVTATAGLASAVVNWSAPTTDGGSPITSYTVRSSPGGATVTTADGSTTSVTVPNLAPETAYTFTVVATNAAGSGAVSAAAGATPYGLDTTPPTLTVPSSFSVNTPDPTGAVVTYTATAIDNADPAPVVSCSPVSGSRFPVGADVVSCTAADASGNKSSGRFTVTVNLVPASLPGDVSGLMATAGSRVVRLAWQLPTAPDFDHVTVTRSEPGGAGPATLVYQGKGTAYIDRSVHNGVTYHYVVVSVYRSGESSAGLSVDAAPKQSLLLTPEDGAHIKTPPQLVWAKIRGATYYNVQIFRGADKILSIWPPAHVLSLKRTWKYHGRRFRLTPGTYRWYVWPGFGSRATARFGSMLGTSTFQIVR